MVSPHFGGLISGESKAPFGGRDPKICEIIEIFIITQGVNLEKETRK